MLFVLDCMPLKAYQIKGSVPKANMNKTCGVLSRPRNYSTNPCFINILKCYEHRLKTLSPVRKTQILKILK